MSWDRLDLLALAMLAGLWVLFFWPLLTPNEAQRLYMVGGDFTKQFYPYHYFAAAEWWAGRVPLWNPYMYGGHPFQADPQTAVFYPLSVLVSLLAGREGLPFRALEWQGLADYLMAAVFSYLFFRGVVRDRLAATLGAVAFAFGGYLTSYPFQSFAMLETSVWLPLVLLLLEVGTRRPNATLIWWSAAGLAMGIAVLAGHPQSALFIAYTAVAYLVFRALSARMLWSRLVIGAAVFGLTAVGCAAVQLLPTAELTMLSNRAAIGYDLAARGYDLVALPGLLMPEWRGEKALYVGVVPLLLALVALRRGPRRYVWFWGIVALVALALSFGDRGLLYRVFHAAVPGFSAFQSQERTAFIFGFAGATLAAYGLAALRRNGRPISVFRLVLLCAILVGAGTLGLTVFRSPGDDFTSLPDLIRVGYARFAVLLAVAAVVLWLATRVNTGRRALFGGQVAWASVLLVLLTTLDMFATNWHNNLTRVDPAATEAQRSVVSFLKSQEKREGEPIRVRPQDPLALPDNYGAIAALPLAAGDSPIIVRRTYDIFSSGEEWRLWQLLNVKYVINFGRTDEVLEEVFAAPPLKVYRVRFSMPRAWVVEDVRQADSAQQAKQMVLSPEFHPGKTAVIEAPAQFQPPTPAEGVSGLRQDIRFNYYSPRRMHLNVTTNRDGLLVLSEVFYPGWEARVDGLPTPIYRTDYILRSIALPAGEHQVEMVYNPPAFWVGLAISAMTLAAVLAAWLWLWWRGRGWMRSRGRLPAGPDQAVEEVYSGLR